MITINIAKNAGFCFGVKRAIEEVEKLLEHNKNIYCIGDIIHNQYVINKLNNKGLIIVEDENEINNFHNKTIVIRSHGIEKHVLSLLKQNNNTIIDLTCPYVKKIHNIVDENTKNGEICIVIGDKNHPEVKGIITYANNEVYVINTENDIKLLKIDQNKPIIVVSQTTSSLQNYKNIIDILTKIFYNIYVYDTICQSTENRQKEAISLAESSDVILVIGSKKSSNTKKLYELCNSKTLTYYIENVDDLNNINIHNNSIVSIVAGASTPLNLIEEITLYARSKF